MPTSIADLPVEDLVVLRLDQERAERINAVNAELESGDLEARISFNDQLFVRQELIKRSEGKAFASQSELDDYVAKCDKIIRLAWQAGIFAALSWLDEPEELLDRALERARAS